MLYYFLDKTRTLIFENSRTHKLVVRYKVIYYPKELPIIAETCTQPNSELVAVDVYYGESPATKYG